MQRECRLPARSLAGGKDLEAGNWGFPPVTGRDGDDKTDVFRNRRHAQPRVGSATQPRSTSNGKHGKDSLLVTTCVLRRGIHLNLDGGILGHEQASAVGEWQPQPQHVPCRGLPSFRFFTAPAWHNAVSVALSAAGSSRVTLFQKPGFPSHSVRVPRHVLVAATRRRTGAEQADGPVLPSSRTAWRAEGARPRAPRRGPTHVPRREGGMQGRFQSHTLAGTGRDHRHTSKRSPLTFRLELGPWGEGGRWLPSSPGHATEFTYGVRCARARSEGEDQSLGRCIDD